MDELIEGFTEGFSARGIGGALFLVLFLAALILIGWGPDRIAAEAQAVLPIGTNNGTNG